MRRKMSGKKMAVLVMAGVLTVLPVFPAMAAGWSQSGGKTYYYQQDGSMATGLRIWMEIIIILCRMALW